MKDLPVYLIQINEDEGSDLEVDAVAIVDRPAVKRHFLAFDEQEARIAFKVANTDRRIISGVAILADTPIYRKDENGKEYYTVFNKETIEKIVQKFHKKGYQKSVNAMHDKAQATTEVVVFESFISDNSRGIRPMVGFEDAPEGSWFISMLVEDDELWQRVKDGDLKGFSVEGLFSFARAGSKAVYSDEESLEEIIRLLAQFEG